MAKNLQSQLRDYKRSTAELKPWSSHSQPIAPVEILVNRLQRGCTLDPIVRVEMHTYGPGRSVSIYHFTVIQEDQKLVIPVQSNPVVHRLIDQYRLEVVPLKSSEAKIES
ncbi:MAG: hypothetical protein DPW16_21040 [Chloroflexi bacterium]|nr:hypothetical protein [Anaerolineae bacterium]MCQ3932944.1 hypothetical protein [Chloroflexota bacterium]